jgi:hypothetical protein
MLKEKPHPSSDRGWIIDLNSVLAILAGQGYHMPSLTIYRGLLNDANEWIAA